MHPESDGKDEGHGEDLQHGEDSKPDTDKKHDGGTKHRKDQKHNRNDKTGVDANVGTGNDDDKRDKSVQQVKDVQHVKDQREYVKPPNGFDFSIFLFMKDRPTTRFSDLCKEFDDISPSVIKSELRVMVLQRKITMTESNRGWDVNEGGDAQFEVRK